jgi:Cupin superfamily protein
MPKSLAASDVTVARVNRKRPPARSTGATIPERPATSNATEISTPADDIVGTACSVGPLSGLSWLIHPFGMAEFRQEHWGERPLVVHRDDPGYFSDLLTFDDMDQILSLTNPHEGNVLLADKDRSLPISRLIKPADRNGPANVLEEIYARYRKGWTVVIKAVQWRWEPLRQFTATLGAEMNASVRSNLYLTPANSQGFPAHYDTHDVYIVQVYGSKRWRLAMGPYRLPLENQRYGELRPAPDPELEFDLSAGDVLYLPRGTVHWGTSQETASLHISLGVHPVLYAEAVMDAIFKLFYADVRFRKALPLGFAADEDGMDEAAAHFTELISTLGERLSPRDIVAECAKRVASANLPVLRHHLTDLEELADVRTDTPVRRRSGQQWHVNDVGNEVSLQFHNKSIRLPAHMEDEVRFVTASSHEFTAADIPGDLDEPGRLFLIQTLLREGFLTRGRKE